jgi:uncharacterized protein (DUF302 family)
MIEHGLITLVSRRSVGNTVDALEGAVKAKGLTVYSRVDFSELAKAAGSSLRPTVVLLFGDPATGVPLVTENQMVGIDLPMRAIVWEDENGEVWVTYQDVAWLVERYGLGPHVAKITDAMRTSMVNVVSTAAGL